MVISDVKDFNRRFSGAPRTVWIFILGKIIYFLFSLVSWIYLWYTCLNSSYNSTNLQYSKSCMDISHTNYVNILYCHRIRSIPIRYFTRKCSRFSRIFRWYFYITLCSTLYYYCVSRVFVSWLIQSDIFFLPMCICVFVFVIVILACLIIL
jgi:hypothetical protein